MKALLCGLMAVATLPSFALAQAPPDPAALAKAVQKLIQRVDHLEKEVAKLKTAADPATVATSAPAAPPPSKPMPGQPVSVPGWKVDALPAGQEGKDSVATFKWDKPDFTFGLHTKMISGHNPYTYRGTATFVPDVQGRYVFQLTLNPVRLNSGWAFRCAGDMKVNDELLVEGKANGYNAAGDYDRNGELFAPSTFSGGFEFVPSTDPKKGYKLTFQVSCFQNEQDHAILDGSLFKAWQDNRFSILVKGPDDPQGRALRGDELFHEGRLKAGN